MKDRQIRNTDTPSQMHLVTIPKHTQTSPKPSSNTSMRSCTFFILSCLGSTSFLPSFCLTDLDLVACKRNEETRREEEIYTKAYIHTYTHTYVHTHIYNIPYTYVRTNMDTYTHAYSHTYIHTYIYHTQIYVHTCTHTHIHHTHAYKHAHIHNMHIPHTHTYIPHTYLPTRTLTNNLNRS